MFGAGRKLIRRFRNAAFGDEGNATIEFVILFPLIMWIFLSSFEVSIYLTRAVLLDRALDLNVRLLRLGTLDPMTQENLQTQVCNDALIFRDCPNAITIELTEIDTQTWNLPNPNVTCVNRDAEIDPPDFATGQLNDLMLVRACTILDPFFGPTPFVLRLPLDPSGGYAVVAASTFVNEP